MTSSNGGQCTATRRLQRSSRAQPAADGSGPQPVIEGDAGRSRAEPRAGAGSRRRPSSRPPAEWRPARKPQPDGRPNSRQLEGDGQAADGVGQAAASRRRSSRGERRCRRRGGAWRRGRRSPRSRRCRSRSRRPTPTRRTARRSSGAARELIAAAGVRPISRPIWPPNYGGGSGDDPAFHAAFLFAARLAGVLRRITPHPHIRSQQDLLHDEGSVTLEPIRRRKAGRAGMETADGSSRNIPSACAASSSPRRPRRSRATTSSSRPSTC